MPIAELPNLPVRTPLKASSKPFLGKRDANLARAVINALMNARVVAIQATSATTLIGSGAAIGPTGDASTAAMQNGIKFTWSKQGLIITVPVGGGSGGGNSSYRGEYDPGGATTFGSGPFNFGDIVRVSPGNAVATTMGGTVIPAVYICIQAGPTSGDLPNHPLSTGGETAFWQWLATWPSSAQTCDGAGETITVFVDQQEKPS